MRKAVAGAAVVLLVGVAACGSDNSVVSGTTAPSNTGSNTQPSNRPKQSIGQVIDIIPVGGTVGGAAAFAGQGVAAKDLIATDPNGKIRFNLGEVLPFCQVETDSEVRAAPGGASLIEVTRGNLLCRTSTSGQLKTFSAGGSVLQAVDPVFILGWNGSEVSLRVAQGFVGVRGPQGTVPVGANQQATYQPDDQPGVGPWDQSDVQGELENTVQAQVSQAQRAAAAPSYPRFDGGDSPALARAVDRGQVRVLLSGNADQDARNLTGALLQRFLQHGPQLKLSVTEATDDEAAAALESGDAELVVSDQFRNRSSRPLFTLDGTTWFVTQSPDGGALMDALRGFLTAALQGGCTTSSDAPLANPGQNCYEETYRRALGNDQQDYVPLDAMAGYLGLS